MISVDCKDGHTKSLITQAIYHIDPATRKPLDATTKIVTTHGRFGYCMTVQKDARIIFLNDRIVPQTIKKEDLEYRWFICVVLHEIAHAFHEHDQEDDPTEEAEAWATAIKWYNCFAPVRHGVPEMKKEEIDKTEIAIKAKWGIVVNSEVAGDGSPSKE